MLIIIALAGAVTGATSTTPNLTNAAPVAVVTDASAKADEDSPEEIAKDSARDLKDSRFYNRPGATRVEYDKAWQECRLIARGSRTPSGTYTYIYNPNIISPLAAGIGAGIGSAIGNAIVQGQIRRANRRSCLMIRGWRLVEVDDAETLKLSAMTDEQRDAFFSTIIGATDLGNRKVTTWTNDFAAPRLAPVSEQ